MSLLSRHLEQISLSSESIATLPFPPPKIFTNALLSTPDITSLIRDTEPHERALFSVPPPQPLASSTHPYPEKPPHRRQTVFNVAEGEVVASSTTGTRPPRRNTAVAAVLGAELNSEVRRAEGGGGAGLGGAGGKGEVDIEVLLRGAERLNDVYSIPGVPKWIEGLRAQHEQLVGSLRHYEVKVERQVRELERINRGDGWEEEEEEEYDSEGRKTPVLDGRGEAVEVTDEDLRREEEEIRDLNRRKRELEERVSGMERDLGGLLR